MTKEKNNFFIATFVNELFTPRLVVGAKRKGDTMNDFLKNRALVEIENNPINKWDAVSEYKPWVYAEVSMDKAMEVGKKTAPVTEYEPKTSLNNMIKYLQDNNYVVYKRKQANKKK